MGWEEILGKSYKKDLKKQQARLGRGKREKMQVCCVGGQGRAGGGEASASDVTFTPSYPRGI